MHHIFSTKNVLNSLFQNRLRRETGQEYQDFSENPHDHHATKEETMTVRTCNRKQVKNVQCTFLMCKNIATHVEVMIKLEM